MHWRLGIMATGVLAALLLAACGEGGSGQPTPAAEPRVTPSCGAIRNVSSYRYTISIQLDIPGAPAASREIDLTRGKDSPLGAFAGVLLGLLHDFQIEGAFVAPDRSQATLTAGSEEIEVRTIGDQSWVRFGDIWQKETSASPEVLLSPDTVCKDIVPDLGRSLSGLDYQSQAINGIATRHYHLDEAKAGQLKALLASAEAGGDLPEQFILDVWLAEEGGWPLRLQLSARGEDEEADGRQRLPGISGHQQPRHRNRAAARVRAHPCHSERSEESRPGGEATARPSAQLRVTAL